MLLHSVTVALFSLACIVPAIGNAQSQPTQHKWTDLSGKFSIDATLHAVDVGHKNVKLSKADGSIVELPLARLSKPDQEFVKYWEYIQTSQQQRDKIQELAYEYPLNAKHSIDGLNQLHRDKVFLAGLTYGTILAAEGGPRRSDDAERRLDESILLLKGIQKYFPTHHAQTLTAALNNRAILSLRGRNTERTTSLLIEAASVEPNASFVVCHNIKTLLSVAANGKVFELSARNRKRLEDMLPEDLPEVSGLNPPPRFLYTVQYIAKAPDANSASSTEDALRQTGIWPELTCFICSGRGFQDCQNCLGGVTSVVRQVQVGVDQTTNAPIMRPKTFPIGCNVCNQKGGFPCPACNGGRMPLGD